MSHVIRNNWWLSGGSGLQPDTNAQGQQAFLIIGDSNAGDTTASTSYGPTTSSGVSLKWNGSGLTDVASTDFSNQAGVYGTPYKKFALDYNAATGNKVVIVNRAVAGSDVSANVDLSDWSETGNLYAPAVSEANACLSFLGVTKFKGIVVWLGVNDINAGVSSSTIITSLGSLITRLQTDFPDTMIYVVSHSVTGTLGMTSQKFTLKKGFRDLSQNNANVELLCNLDQFNQYGYVSGIHLTQTGYNKIGEFLSRTISSSETNKEVRQVLNLFHDELPNGAKNGWKTFIEWCQLNNCWIDGAIDCLHIYKASSRLNVFFDATNIQSPLDGLFDFSSNSFITTNTAKTIFDNYVPSICAVNTSVTDFAIGIKTVVNYTPAGTQGVVFVNPSGSLRRLFQTSTNVVNYNVNDSTNTSFAETKIQNNTWYTIRRSGTTKNILKDGVQVGSATVSAGVITNTGLEIGGSSSEINCEFEAYYVVKQSVVNISDFNDQLDALLASI